MTLKAVRTLQDCSMIAAVRASGREAALSIAREAVSLRNKPIIHIDLPMKHPEHSYDRAAEALCRALLSGDAALLCLGDCSLYASAVRLCKRVRARGFAVKVVPGVPSFCAMAASAGIPLAMGDTPLQILPYGCEDFAERLKLSGAKVIMKCGAYMQPLTELLEKLGLLEQAYAAENVGTDEEKVYPDLRNAKDCGYFTTVYISG
jgi:precorrin-2/cobalt-factor-2 C20-methyltransferase